MKRPRPNSSETSVAFRDPELAGLLIQAINRAIQYYDFETADHILEALRALSVSSEPAS